MIQVPAKIRKGRPGEPSKTVGVGERTRGVKDRRETETDVEEL